MDYFVRNNRFSDLWVGKDVYPPIAHFALYPGGFVTWSNNLYQNITSNWIVYAMGQETVKLLNETYRNVRTKNANGMMFLIEFFKGVYIQNLTVENATVPSGSHLMLVN